MKTTINCLELERVSKENRYKDYKLCYIDDIPETCSGDSLSRKAHGMTDEDLRKEYPNPDYISGMQTLSAIFTPVPLEMQWGDDWDDTTYECNAGSPYDYYHNEKGESEEIELLEILFYLPKQYGDITFPRDYGFNSPFSIRDINAGAVAWIYYRDDERNPCTGPVAICAGCSPSDFVEKIRRILKAMGESNPEDDNARLAITCAAIDEGDSSPDVIDFDEEEFIAEMKRAWRK
ncbi:MAG: hypothetical protein J6037_04470 [Bacteroidales bacterium]|nr:hypothetical protein [Bacteroidales bacterium]